MPKYDVFQQLAPRRKVVGGVEEWEPRLIKVGQLDATNENAAIDAARNTLLVFRIGYRKSSLHRWPIVQEVQP